MTPKEIYNQIDRITVKLIELSLSEEQFYPSIKDNKIYITGDFDQSISLRNVEYYEIYETIKNQKNFNMRLIDGALLQFMFSFNEKDELVKHRLAFFPCPYLLAYDEDYEIYLNDEIYSDVLMKNILPVPIRFDFDSKSFIAKDHPRSHLTLGQYKNCRIPLSQPLTPIKFILFIIRNFYNAAFKIHEEEFNKLICNNFNRSIERDEETLLHLNFANV